jgi:hypothetical protein
MVPVWTFAVLDDAASVVLLKSWVGSTDEAVKSLMILVASLVVFLWGMKFAVVGESVAWWIAPWICVAC